MDAHGAVAVGGEERDRPGPRVHVAPRLWLWFVVPPTALPSGRAAIGRLPTGSRERRCRRRDGCRDRPPWVGVRPVAAGAGPQTPWASGSRRIALAGESDPKMVKVRVNARSLGSAAAALMLGASVFPARATAPIAPAQPGLPCAAREDRPDDYPAVTRAGVVALVKDFIRAYNDGDFVRLEEVFSQEEDFLWYFVQGERERTDAERRQTLPPYFVQRHLLGDRLQVLKLSVRRERGWHGGYDFFIRLRRESDEARARGTWHGKGAADCAIFVWSIGKE